MEHGTLEKKMDLFAGMLDQPIPYEGESFVVMGRRSSVVASIGVGRDELRPS